MGIGARRKPLVHRGLHVVERQIGGPRTGNFRDPEEKSWMTWCLWRCRSGFFCFARVRARLRPLEIGASMLGTVLLLAICVLLVGYLLAALLWPERF